VITAFVLIGEILQVKGNVSHLQIAAAAQFMRYVPVVTYSSGVGRLVELQVSGEDLALRLALRSVDAGRSSGRG
jgi:hypothetical protein